MSSTCDDVVTQEDVPDLVPARMLNEFAYCPRLAYLEWVQGEFADNLETIEGRFGHRRVDAPSQQEVPEADGSPRLNTLAEGEGTGDTTGNATGDTASETIHSRSVMLSAPAEKLIAKIDVLDLQAGIAVPVDYKRGSLPDVPGNAWEPEMVQVCAQGLILRENGYLCEAGILYYIESRRRITIPFDEALVDRTRDLVEEIRAMAARGQVPPPLNDSPKCPRCSLVGICLPDEVCLLLRQETSSEKADAIPTNSPSVTCGQKEVRRLTPARDDAMPLYIQEQGVTLGKSGDVLTVKSRQQTLQKVKLMDVSQVSLFGNVQMTAQALREIAAADVPVCHFSYGGWFHAVTRGMTHKNIELRIKQFAAAADVDQSLAFAKQFVLGKIKNCRTLLRRHLDVSDAKETLVPLGPLAHRAEQATSAESLLGIEGMAAKIYFAGFARLLKGVDQFDMDGRNRRPPRDPVNALLSFVYAILVKEWTLALYATGFDPMLGFYHRPRYGRPSLALDMTESFRPLIGDSTVLMLINNGEVTHSSFVRRAGGVALTDAGRRAVLASFERRMDSLVTHPIFGYRISYRRVLEVQARLLGRTLLGEIPEYPNFCTR